MSQSLWVRNSQGTVAGPLSIAEIKQQIKQGVIHPEDELSKNQVHWHKVTELLTKDARVQTATSAAGRVEKKLTPSEQDTLSGSHQYSDTNHGLRASHVKASGSHSQPASKQRTAKPGTKNHQLQSPGASAGELVYLQSTLVPLTRFLQHKLMIHRFLQASALGTMPIAMYLLVGDPQQVPEGYVDITSLNDWARRIWPAISFLLCFTIVIGYVYRTISEGEDLPVSSIILNIYMLILVSCVCFGLHQWVWWGMVAAIICAIAFHAYLDLRTFFTLGRINFSAANPIGKSVLGRWRTILPVSILALLALGVLIGFAPSRFTIAAATEGGLPKLTPLSKYAIDGLSLLLLACLYGAICQNFNFYKNLAGIAKLKKIEAAAGEHLAHCRKPLITGIVISQINWFSSGEYFFTWPTFFIFPFLFASVRSIQDLILSSEMLAERFSSTQDEFTVSRSIEGMKKSMMARP